MPSLRTRRGAAVKASEAIKASTDISSDSNNARPSRRAASGANEPPKALVSRDPPSSPSNQQSLRLTVKLSSSKLREATGGSNSRPSRTASTIAVKARDGFIGGEIVEGKRARNVKKSYVLESDSDEEDEEMEDVGDDDAEGESVDEEDDLDEDAEGEDEDADGDVDMDIPPPPPVIKISKASKDAKPVISVKPAGKSDGKTVEQKETLQDSDDEELSELDSSLEEDEEGMQVDNEEDAEGEDEEIEIEVDDEEEDEDELDSDDDTPGGGSRASTPDLTKMTKRQRAILEEGGAGHLLALPDGKIAQYDIHQNISNVYSEVQVKKHLTAEEHAMRRAEMARRRKNLSEKRNEEEKV
jgi:Ino eighty subunit 2